jgi:type IV secretory pathway VirB2 component (pilin)
MVVGLRVVTDLELHALNVSHDNGHLGSLCSLVEQCHLAQIVCSLCGSLTRTLAVRSILEAGVSLRALGLLWSLLCLLVHGAIEVLAARCWRVHRH